MLAPPPALAPSLTLSILRLPARTDEFEVKLEDGTVGRELRIGGGSVAELERDTLPFIRNELEKIRETLGWRLDNNYYLGKVVQALNSMYELGSVLITRLNIEQKKLNMFRILVRQKSNNFRFPLRIEFRTPKQWPIPLEIIPLDQQPADASLPIKEGVLKHALIFPAFNSIIRHTFINTGKSPDERALPISRRIHSEPCIPLLFLWYEGAPYADEAYESLCSLSRSDPRVQPDRPLPAFSSNCRSADVVAKLLMDDNLLMGNDAESSRWRGGSPYRLIHIHAHGRTGEPGLSNSNTLLFAYRETGGLLGILSRKRELHVTNGLLAKTRPGSSETKSGPLIFINACGGAAASYGGGLGMADEFLRVGYRAVVGPRVSLPGPLADRFAKWLYFIWVMLRPISLGEAIYRTRTILLNNYCNLTGAFYSVFGESGLYIG